jgi:hypothetical protein
VFHVHLVWLLLKGPVKQSTFHCVELMPAYDIYLADFWQSVTLINQYPHTTVKLKCELVHIVRVRDPGGEVSLFSIHRNDGRAF